MHKNNEYQRQKTRQGQGCIEVIYKYLELITVLISVVFGVSISSLALQGVFPIWFAVTIDCMCIFSLVFPFIYRGHITQKMRPTELKSGRAPDDLDESVKFDFIIFKI